MSMYVKQIKPIVERLSVPVMFLLMSLGSSAVSLWCMWSLFEWAYSK